MKINLAWLADFVDLAVDQDELLTRINTQLGEIESVINLEEKYKDILIVKVVSVQPHPNADKLSVCLVDDGRKFQGLPRQKNGYVEVVCGATNVWEGMLAAWLPPASIMPATFDKVDNRIQLGIKEIRGVLSHGMLASLFELDLGADKDGILDIKVSSSTLPNEYPQVKIDDSLVGQSFAPVFDLATTVIDIENKMFTHRPDCFGLLGVAREIAAITKSVLKKPAWYSYADSQTPVKKGEALNLDIQCPDLVTRFRALLIRDLKVGPSDLILQTRLASIGFKPVNNVVDMTNYMMYVSGQPTHAFDYDKLLQLSSSQNPPLTLVVRQAVKKETLKLLNGKTAVFDQPAIVIATDKKPIALGGIMGGSEAEVDQSTRTVLLECANFNMYSLRRTTMHYGIFSEAATRFTKGQSRAQIPSVAHRTADLIAYSTAGQIEPPIYEFQQAADQSESKSLLTTAKFINQRLGSELTTEVISSLLTAVEFNVKAEGEQLRIDLPFWRTDIEIAEDIVEEIGRLNGGYMTLKPVLPIRPIRPADNDELLSLKAQIRRCLAARGANEVLGYSFVSAESLAISGQDDENSFHLHNPLNPNLAVYRQSLTPSLMAMVETNRRSGHKNFALFEIGCAHQKNQQAIDQDGLPLDLQRVGFICHLTNRQAGSSFYAARRYLDLVARSLGLQFDYEVYDREQHDEMPAMHRVYDLNHSASVTVAGHDLGIIGLLNRQGNRAGWEIKTDILLQAQKSGLAQNLAYRPLAKYPTSSQDLTLQVPIEVPYGHLRRTLESTLMTYHHQGWRTRLNLLSIFCPDEPNVKNISFRLVAGQEKRTVRKDEVSDIISALVKKAQSQHQAHQVV